MHTSCVGKESGGVGRPSTLRGNRLSAERSAGVQCWQVITENPGQPRASQPESAPVRGGRVPRMAVLNVSPTLALSGL